MSHGEAGSDIALMLRVREGHEDAFEALYRRFYRQLQHFFFALSRDPQAAEDLCHETFLRLWKRRARYVPTGSAGAYIFAFARFIWLEHCRAMRQHRLTQPLSSVEAWLDTRPTARDDGPDALAGRREFEEQLDAALRDLPDEQRMVFVMRNVVGMGIEEIAETLQCPVNTVRSRRILAIQKLRNALRDIWAL